MNPHAARAPQAVADAARAALPRLRGLPADRCRRIAAGDPISVKALRELLDHRSVAQHAPRVTQWAQRKIARWDRLSTEPWAANDPAPPEHHTGIMVALMIAEGDATDLALDDPGAAGKVHAPGELHLTLAYLGDTNEVTDEAQYIGAVLSALRDVAAKHKQLVGMVSGIGRFSLPDGDAIYYSFDSPDLFDLRHDIVAALDETDGVKVSRNHGFTPHITVAEIAPGADSPIRRADPHELRFDAITLAFGENRIEVPLGRRDVDEQEDPMRQTPASTAPSARDTASKARKPWEKNTAGGDGGEGSKPPIAAGAFVSWASGGGGKGRVDMVVTNGTVPGVGADQKVQGTKDSPAVRIVVWTKDGDTWKASSKKIAAKAGGVKRIPPLTVFGRKDAASPATALVALLAGHEARVDAEALGDIARVSGRQVKAVFERGVDAWPGEDMAGVTAEQWATGRVAAFLRKAAGEDVEGYTRDDDLLPAPWSGGDPDDEQDDSGDVDQGDGTDAGTDGEPAPDQPFDAKALLAQLD